MVNKIQLVGNVGKDPETHTFESGKKVASFSLATSETYKNKQGEKQTDTEWHNIKIYGKLADIVEKYVKKGQLLYLDGTVKYKSYEKDGKKIYFTEIQCFNMKMLGKNSNTDEPTNEQSQPQILPLDDNGGDDLPF